MTAERPEPSRQPRRPPVDVAALTRSLVRDGGLWRQVAVTASTGSTNADLVAAARAGAAEGTVLVAEEQTAGRGRLGRAWLSPPRAALTFSVLLRPRAVPPARRGWLPLLAGVATAVAVRAQSGVAAELKWPNDVLVAGSKLAGILAEACGDTIVVGIGLNVSTLAADFPSAAAAALPPTSLLLETSTEVDRQALLVRLLAEFEERYLAWLRARQQPLPSGSADPDHVLRGQYRALCATVGAAVRVDLPDGTSLRGVAEDVDQDGRLVVSVPLGSPPAGSTRVTVAAGDVVHVR